MTDAPKTPVQQCSTCSFYRLKLLGIGGSEGRCHRFPPSATILNSPTGPITATYFPAPKPIEWCGEYKVKLRIAENN